MSIKSSTDPMNYLSGEFNSVLNFRGRAFRVLAFTLVPFLLPFSLNSFIQGRIAMGFLTMIIVTLAITNALSIHRRGSILVPFYISYFIILATLILGMATIGTMIGFWCYPVAFAAIFISQQREGRILIGIGIALLVPCAFLYMPPDYAIRFAITYIMACYFGDQVVRLLNEMQQQLTELAIRDPLTGAYNRRHMQACLTDAIEEYRRNLNVVTLIALDIDSFKEINDSLGHEAGDKALKSLVEILDKRTRKLDLVFRTGGDEFIVLTRDVSPGHADTFANDLRVFVEKFLLLNEESLTISLGIAHYDGKEDVGSWLNRADLNLYKAKQQGRNRVWPLPIEQ